MKVPDDSGPAFPTPESEWTKGADGMSLRDYFAAKAMGHWDIGEHDPDDPESCTHEEVARCCYRMADAMLKVRKEEVSDAEAE